MGRVRPGGRGAFHLTEYYEQTGAGSASEVFDPAAAAFTAGMSKRPGQGPFDAAPIVQGNLDVSTADLITYPLGDIVGNPLDFFHETFDVLQGTILFWLTPEWDGDDGLHHWFWRGSDLIEVLKHGFSNFYLKVGSYTHNTVSTAAWTAGTTYFIVCRWDLKHTLDGTNVMCVSVNNVHTYGGTGVLGKTNPDDPLSLGYDSGDIRSGAAIIEGFTILRRALYDSNGYGTAPMEGTDELTAIYAAGAGADPSEVIGGSWDTPLCIPTDCQTGALVTGTGEAWSHPWDQELLDVTFMHDGDPPGTPYAVEFDKTSDTVINCGSDASLDDIPSGAEITVSGWFRLDDDPDAYPACFVAKGQLNSDGWMLRYNYVTEQVSFRVHLATTHATATAAGTYGPDGKWHHFAGYYDDATQTAYCAVDGKWGSADVGAGAYQSDAAEDLKVGQASSGAAMKLGTFGFAWVELWDNDHLGAGTNFIPPRAPTAAGPGNLIETWWADEGTGVTVAARVASPNNDGTIANGSWSRIWEQEGTPVIQPTLEFDGADTHVVVADNAAIQDLHAGQFTIDIWARVDSYGETYGRLIDKGVGVGGWSVVVNSATGGLEVLIQCATTDARSVCTTANFVPDEAWHYISAQFDGTALPAGNPQIYLWIDGRPATAYSYQDAGVGNAVTDVGSDLWIGDRSTGSRAYDGLMAFIRLSDTLRYTPGKAFIPPGLGTPPAADGNTVVQYEFTDGAGTTLTDIVVPLNGTITMGSGRWWNSCDMEYLAVSERVYQWGYMIASDGVDGLTIIEDAEVTAGVSYVVRAVVSIDMSGTARPYIYIYDNTGAAQIGANFYFPRMTGQATANGASLTDTNARWIQQFAGWTVFNVTDGSLATITSNTEQNIVGALAGGAANTWAIGDYYLITPPSRRYYSQHPWAETFVFTAPAGCTSIDVKVLNAAGEGTIHVHQVEVLESMIEYGCADSGAGNPWVITNWTNINLALGESSQELAVVHAGVSSLEIDTPAIGSAGQRSPDPGLTAGIFYCRGSWMYELIDNIWFQTGGSLLVLQSDATSTQILSADATRWKEYASVVRMSAAGAATQQWRCSIPGHGYYDDAYMFALNDVSLTVTPCSAANSVESGGLRVDGEDTCTTVPTHLTAAAGIIVCDLVLRQDLADADEFDTATQRAILVARLDANNWIGARIRPDLGATHVEIHGTTGGVAFAANAALPGAVTWGAGETKAIRVRYTTGNAWLYVDGQLAVTSALGAPLAGAPTIIYWGSGVAEAQLDAVVA